MVIAIGSYPIGRRFESHRRYQTACRRFAGGAFIPEAVRLSETTTAPCGLYRWPRGQAVKTSPFHGGNTSSILVGVTTKRERFFNLSLFAVSYARSERARRSRGCSREQRAILPIPFRGFGRCSSGSPNANKSEP